MAVTLNASTSAGFVQTADTSGILQLQTANTTAVTIDASQNMGLGTSSPAGKLDVNGSAYIRGNLEMLAPIEMLNANYLYLYNTGSSTYWDLQNNSNNLAFRYNASEKMRLDSSGNLGVGTTSPTTRLEVNGNVLKIYDQSTSNANLVIRNSTTGNAAGFTIQQDGVNTLFYNNSNGYMAFATNAAERARIDSSGNLLVGTTSTQNGVISVYCNDNSRNCITTQILTNGNNAIGFYNAGGTQVGSITTNSSTVTYNTSSDYRLKEDIQPMTGALAKIEQLKPVTYKWKVDGSDGEGFIAHELQEVVPDCVTGEKDAVDADGNPVYQGIDTSFLVATLTAAIQEQQAIIQTLTARIEALEGAK